MIKIITSVKTNYDHIISIINNKSFNRMQYRNINYAIFKNNFIKKAIIKVEIVTTYKVIKKRQTNLKFSE